MLKWTSESPPAVGFPSSWKNKRQITSNSTQSEPLEIVEIGCQTVSHAVNETQTDAEREDPPPPTSDLQPLRPSLVAFVMRASELMLRELDDSDRSRAFDGYQLIDDDQQLPATRIHALQMEKQASRQMVSSTSWNSHGSVLAVGYSHLDHESWCEHPSLVAFWNVNRYFLMLLSRHYLCVLGMSLHYAHLHRVYFQRCLTGGGFPSSAPATGGSVVCDCSGVPLGSALSATRRTLLRRGEVLLYDTSAADDPLVCSTASEMSGHREPVSALHWRSRDSSGHRLVSAARDGKLLLWRYSEAPSQRLKLVKQFQLMADQLRRADGRRAGRADSEAGITCLSFSHFDPDLFLLGSEGGGLFLGTLLSQTPVGAAARRGEHVLNPVTATFQPHHGQLLALHCSSFHRNIFISVASDSQIRVGNILQASALLSISLDVDVTAAAICRSRPLLVVVSTAAGELRLVDLARGGALLHVINPADKPQPTASMHFCRQQQHLLSCGSFQGRTDVWSLCSDLVSPLPAHLSEVTRMGDVLSSETV